MGGCASAAPAVGGARRPGFHKAYKLGEKLGDGGFGQVWEATEITTGKVHAVKILDLRVDRHTSPKQAKALNSTSSLANLVNRMTSLALFAARKEVDIWRRVGNSDHCVKLLDTYGNAPKSQLFYIVMERCPGGDLMKHIGDTLEVGEQVVSSMLGQMLLGIQWVHRAGVVHCDVKPANFVLGGKYGMTVKLCDFGSAYILPPAPHLIDHSAVGTRPYMSPEMIGDPCGYRESTDIWSLGVTAYLFLYGAFPFTKLTTTEDSAVAWAAAICKGPWPSFERQKRNTRNMEEPSHNAAAFVAALLKRDPKQRCTVEEALGLEFVNIDKTSIADRHVHVRL